MDKRLSITVDGVAYPVKFGYKVTRFLGEMWELEGIFDVFQKVLSILNVDGEDPEKLDLAKVDEKKLGASILKFENLDIIRDVAWAGMVAYSKEEVHADPDEVLEVLLEDMSVLSDIFRGYLQSMPKPKEEPKPAKTTGKQKAPAKTRSKKSG